MGFSINPAGYDEGFEWMLINSGNAYTFFLNNNGYGNVNWWCALSDLSSTWTGGVPPHPKGGCANNSYCYVRKVIKQGIHAWMCYGPGAILV